MKSAATIALTLGLIAGSAPGFAQSRPELASGCAVASATSAPAVSLPQIATALRENRKINILTIGASSASARGAGRNYYDVIETYLETAFKGLDVEILDRGVSGELARDAAERIKLEVALNEIDLVLWQVGTFDAMARVPTDAFEQTLIDTTRWLRSRKIDVVLIGLHYLRDLRDDDGYQAIRKILQRVVDQEKILRIGRYEAGETLEKAMELNKLAPDEFAMTAEGYACMADAVARALATGLFAKQTLNGAVGSETSR